MKFKRRPMRLAVGMDITPLIDIVFLQLIFFMLTSSFVFQPGIKIHLPQASTAQTDHRQSWTITVSAKGHLYLGSKLVTLQELKTKLSGLSKAAVPLLIQADQQASLGRVVEVWDLCRSLGIQKVSIATSPRE
jgi:biopolymer transport protein ExbD